MLHKYRKILHPVLILEWNIAATQSYTTLLFRTGSEKEYYNPLKRQMEIREVNIIPGVGM